MRILSDKHEIYVGALNSARIHAIKLRSKSEFTTSASQITAMRLSHAIIQKINAIAMAQFSFRHLSYFSIPEGHPTILADSDGSVFPLYLITDH